VKYTTGASVQSISGGRSVQTFVPTKGLVTLEARPSFPYSFVQWTGLKGDNSSPTSLSITSPTVIQAVFAPSYVDLIGLPGAVFASALSVYLARSAILGSGKQILRNLRLRKKDLRD